MIVAPAAVGARAIDTVTHLDAAHCGALRAAGVDFVIRYLGGITPPEMATILDGWLGLSLVTFSRAPGWTPSAELGSTDAARDLVHLAELASPLGATVWIDLEGCAGGPVATAGWVNARSAALRAAGYDVGLYVGAGEALDGEQLYALPHVDRYWKSLSRVPEPTCGWSMLQRYPSTHVGGVWCDINDVQADTKGRTPNIIRG